MSGPKIALAENSKSWSRTARQTLLLYVDFEIFLGIFAHGSSLTSLRQITGFELFQLAMPISISFVTAAAPSYLCLDLSWISYSYI